MPVVPKVRSTRPTCSSPQWPGRSSACATTFDRKYIEKDANAERRFQSIAVEPLNEEDTLAILKGLRGRYEQHHKVDIIDDAWAAVELSGRYMSNRVQPDKSIDVIDEAAARG